MNIFTVPKSPNDTLMLCDILLVFRLSSSSGETRSKFLRAQYISETDEGRRGVVTIKKRQN